MDEIRALLREATHPPTTVVPLAAVRVRVRRRLRRRAAATVAAAVVGVLGVGAATAAVTSAGGAGGAEPELLASASAVTALPSHTPNATAAPARSSCGDEPGEPEVSEVTSMSWPSGVQPTHLTLNADAHGECRITVHMPTARADDADVTAAAARWGDRVVVTGRDTSSMGPSPTST